VDGIIDPKKNPGQRTKAARLRKKAREGREVTPEEIAWLEDYDRAQQQGAPTSFGASASERIINIEERNQSVGTGAAAEVAAAAALAREEGRRLDYLLTASVNALMKAVETYEKVTTTLLERTQVLEDVHMGMLETVRNQYIARTQAEVDAIAAGAKEDDNALLNQLGSVLLGQLTTSPAKAK